MSRGESRRRTCALLFADLILQPGCKFCRVVSVLCNSHCHVPTSSGLDFVHKLRIACDLADWRKSGRHSHRSHSLAAQERSRAVVLLLRTLFGADVTQDLREFQRIGDCWHAVKAKLMILLAFVAGVLALNVDISLAKCIGATCSADEASAKASGLLGAEEDTCKGRDRSFAFNPQWKTTLHSELLSMSWSGGDDQWVWAITTGAADEYADNQFHHVYWSKDYGKTMVDKFPALQQLVRAQPGGGIEQTMDDLNASVKAVLVHAANPKKVILWGEGKFLFISQDAGESFTVVPMPKDTFGMSHLTRPHPTQPDWLLSMAYRNSCYEGDVFSECSMDLWLSKDFGQTWENLTEKTKGKLAGFIDFDWGYHTADPKYQTLFKETTIIATGHTQVYRTTSDIIAEDISLFRSDDDFASFEKLASCGAAFELIAGQLFFVHPDICSIDVWGRDVDPPATRRDALSLYVSSDGFHFSKVCLPTDLTDSAYTMVSTQDGRGAFMIADHAVDSAAVSNLYANGNIAELYTMSLRNVHFGYDRQSKPDLMALRPVPGRYIANALESPTSVLPKRINDLDMSAVQVTKITHNAGASWHLISVDPANVRNTVCKAACQKGQPCYLHLHGASSWVRGSSERPAVWASAAAPGIVMASGNLGPEKIGLKTDKNDLCTWLSRDGGLTWIDVIDDVYIYEYINHGNMIAMAKFREEGPAEYLHVSLDQGQCFYSIRIQEEDAGSIELYVNNLLVEPDGAATIIHVTGSEHNLDTGARNDVIYTIDIAEVLEGPDVNGTVLAPRHRCDDGDFEDWTVSKENSGPMCVFGKHHTFHRVGPARRETSCLLPKDYALAESETEECNCEKQDLHCEYGFEKQTNSGCKPMSLSKVPECKAITDDAYKPSKTHLRLGHGMTCPNLKSFIPDTNGNGDMEKSEWADYLFQAHVEAPPARRRSSSRSHGSSRGGGSSSAGSTVFWAFMVLIAGVAAVAGLARFGPDKVKEALATAAEGAIGGALFVYDSARGLLSRAQGVDNPEALGFERLGDSNQPDLYAVP
eukprot:jgi/Ulvmu1/12438/UM009_0090.1